MNVLVRFFKNCVGDPTKGCWYWNRFLTKQGYGRFYMNKQIHQAHRASYLLFKGPIPPEMCVCHSCDVPRCVNPKHLFLGTPKDNTTDSIKKGRFACGERGSLAKLTEQDVFDIRRAFKKQDATQLELAKKFGIQRGTVSDITRRKSWKHV